MRAFVAMPFSKEFDIYWQCIQDVCTAEKIKFFRVDKNLSFERNIDIAIRKEIASSDFIIAILTGDQNRQIPNPNVAYEVGYAQGIGKEVIFLAESVECLPFDFKQQRTCLYQQDTELFSQLLEQEVRLLQPKLEKENQRKLKDFFDEIRRCLEIVLPPEYRLFRDSIGFQDSGIWYAMAYFKEKYFIRYTVNCGEDTSKIELQVWLSDESLRNEQKAFARKHYEHLRDNLGFNAILLLDERENSPVGSMAMSKSLVIEPIQFENNALGTKEALTIALRLRVFIKTLHPLFLQFAQSKGLELHAI